MASSETEPQVSRQCHLDRDVIQSELDKKGYCVIPNVVTSEECDARVASYRDWLSQFGNDWPFNVESLIQSYQIGHFEATWETRIAAKKVFETVWQTKKLLTSFDGVAIAPPPEADGEDHNGFAKPEAHWLHLDHSVRRQGLHCYQGAVYLEETSETDYCFRVLEGSHAHTDDFYRENAEAGQKASKIDFYRLSKEQVQWFNERGCPLTKVPVPKGGMVLWDSRTVHDNQKPEFGRPNSDRWRFVVLVCMCPARWASIADLSKKREAYKKILMTTHWPSQHITSYDERVSDTFISAPQLMSKLPLVARSEEAKKLAGVEEYDFHDEEPDGPEWNPQWEE